MRCRSSAANADKDGDEVAHLHRIDEKSGVLHTFIRKEPTQIDK